MNTAEDISTKKTGLGEEKGKRKGSKENLLPNKKDAKHLPQLYYWLSHQPQQWNEWLGKNLPKKPTIFFLSSEWRKKPTPHPCFMSFCLFKGHIPKGSRWAYLHIRSHKSVQRRTEVQPVQLNCYICTNTQRIPGKLWQPQVLRLWFPLCPYLSLLFQSFPTWTRKRINRSINEVRIGAATKELEKQRELLIGLNLETF